MVGLLALGFWVPIDLAYGIYAAAVLFTTPFTWIAARETALSQADCKPYDSSELLRCVLLPCSPTTNSKPQSPSSQARCNVIVQWWEQN